jgi:hypothetical protein
MFVSSKHTLDSEAEGLTRYFRSLVDFSFNFFFFAFIYIIVRTLAEPAGTGLITRVFFLSFPVTFFLSRSVVFFRGVFAKHGLGWIWAWAWVIGVFLAYMNASIRYDGQALTARTWIFLSSFPFVLSKRFSVA